MKEDDGRISSVSGFLTSVEKDLMVCFDDINLKLNEECGSTSSGPCYWAMQLRVERRLEKSLLWYTVFHLYQRHEVQPSV